MALSQDYAQHNLEIAPILDCEGQIYMYLSPLDVSMNRIL